MRSIADPHFRVENYETFCGRLRPVLPPRELMLVEVAYVFSKHGHRAQVRKNEKDPRTGKALRYFEHPRRVTLILIDIVGCVEPAVLQAALIHDGVEDTKLIRPLLVEVVFGEKVANIVKLLSKKPKRGYLKRLVAFGDWRVLLIKACDRLDNLRTMTTSSREFQIKQVTETRKKYFPVFDLMLRRVPARYRAGATRVYDEIKAIVTRYEATFEKTS